MSPRARRLCKWSNRVIDGVDVPAHAADPGKDMCATHRAAADARRGTRAQRGYGTEHQAARREWAPIVATGKVKCWRCHRPITRFQRWIMGHQDDRTLKSLPEHERCNAEAAGKAAHGIGQNGHSALTVDYREKENDHDNR